jgi:hypothetical protein
MNWISAVLGLAVAIVGYLGWMTAHQRIVVDLFDRRFKVYDELREAVSTLLTNGTIDSTTLFSYLRTTNRARFLFGPEVVEYLEARYKDLVAAQIAERRNPPHAPTDEQVQAYGDLFERLGNFYQQTDNLFGPYMRLHQKLPSMWLPFSLPQSRPSRKSRSKT